MRELKTHRSRRYVRRDLWRNKAIEIRAQFERNRNVRDPRAVAALLTEAEREVQKVSHPDPYRRESRSPCSVGVVRLFSRSVRATYVLSRLHLVRHSPVVPGWHKVVSNCPTRSSPSVTPKLIMSTRNTSRERNIPVRTILWFIRVRVKTGN